MSVKYIVKEDVDRFVVGTKVGVVTQHFSRTYYDIYEVVKMLPTQIVLNKDIRFKRDKLKRVGEPEFTYARMVVIDHTFITLWKRQKALRTITNFKFEHLETTTLIAIENLIKAETTNPAINPKVVK